VDFKSFAMNSVIGAVKLHRAEKAAEAEAAAEIERERREFERQVRLQNMEAERAFTLSELERERERKAQEATRKAMEQQARQLNEANGFRFDDDGQITFVPKGATIYKPKFDLSGFDEFEMDFENRNVKKAEPLSRLTPFSGLVTEPKEQEPFEFPLTMTIGEYRQRLAKNDFAQPPQYGRDVVGPVLRTSGTGYQTYNMNAVRDFTFQEDFFTTAVEQKKQGNPENYDRLITLWNNTWNSYKETNEARQTTEDGIVRVDTILSFIPEENRDVLLQDPTFVDRVIMPTIDESFKVSRDQVLAELGLPMGGPADIDEDGKLEVDTNSYPHLSWAIDPKTNAYTGDFQQRIQEISTSAGITQSETFQMLDGLGARKSQDFLTNFTAARKWFAKNEPFVVRNNMVTIEGSRMAPPGVDVGRMLQMFDSPKDRMQVAKAILGPDVIDGIPGVTEGGKITAMQALSQSALGKDIRDIAKMESSSTAIITDTTSLIELIDSGMVEGGLAGVIKTKGSAVVTQAEKIMRRLDFTSLPTNGVSVSDLEIRSEQQALVQDALGDISKGEIAAEKLYNALTASLMYGVASMLQGGDFRNISDQDIVLAGGRMGNLMDLLNNPETARPVLEQLREQAQFQLELTQAFVRGDVSDVAAATLLNEYRGRNPEDPLQFIDMYYGQGAGSADPLSTQGATATGIPTATTDE
jgi:hypothetical protein